MSFAFQPRAYAINHSTAYGGRETVKVLMTLLDEEALVRPCRNKAELLSEDHAVLNGSTGAGLLALYKYVLFSGLNRLMFFCLLK